MNILNLSYKPERLPHVYDIGKENLNLEGSSRSVLKVQKLQAFLTHLFH